MKKNSSTLEAYNKIPILISVEITDGMVESVAQNNLGSLGPGGW